MTYEDAINKWIKPAIEKMWNPSKCEEILQAIEQKEKEKKGDNICTSIKLLKNTKS